MTRFATASIVLAAATTLVLADAASAAVTVQVRASDAPNSLGSPSFTGYFQNLRTAFESGLPAVGNPTLPTYYSDATVLTGYDAVVTNFTSFRGNANPGAAFSGELGNRAAFPVRVLGNGEKISLSNLTRTIVDSRSDNSLGVASGAPSATGYTPFYIGIDYGADALKGTPDDVLITSGSGSQLVDEIIGRGTGTAYAALTSDVGATNQEKIDNVVADGFDDVPFTLTGSYVYDDSANGNGSVTNFAGVTFVSIPEPAALAAFGIGAGLLLRRHRRTSRA